mmetsp:Transcript_46731/g.146902  ORF Transcript_46731/g.146902 Transcript_46731/m.146902 type:complete len:670 (-) Transcript_46731:611-2620(-)
MDDAVDHSGKVLVVVVGQAQALESRVALDTLDARRPPALRLPETEPLQRAHHALECRLRRRRAHEAKDRLRPSLPRREQLAQHESAEEARRPREQDALASAAELQRLLPRLAPLLPPPLRPEGEQRRVATHAARRLRRAAVNPPARERDAVPVRAQSRVEADRHASRQGRHLALQDGAGEGRVRGLVRAAGSVGVEVRGQLSDGGVLEEGGDAHCRVASLVERGDQPRRAEGVPPLVEEGLLGVDHRSRQLEHLCPHLAHRSLGRRAQLRPPRTAAALDETEELWQRPRQRLVVELARDLVGRELVHRDDEGRDHVVRHGRVQLRTRLARRRLAGAASVSLSLEDDEGGEMLVRPLLAHHANHARGDPLALQQRRLDGAQLHRVAADLLHRVVPPQDLERPVRTQPAPVARVVQPRVEDGGGRVLAGRLRRGRRREGGRPRKELLGGEVGPLQVPAGKAGTGDEHLAGQAERDGAESLGGVRPSLRLARLVRLVRVLQNEHLDPVQQRAGRAVLSFGRRGGGEVDHGHVVALGDGVEVEQLEAGGGEREHARAQLRRHHLAAQHDHAEGGKGAPQLVARGQGGGVEDCLEEGGREEHAGDGVPLQEGGEGGRVVDDRVRHHDQRRPLQQRPQHLPDEEDVASFAVGAVRRVRRVVRAVRVREDGAAVRA